ncbi:MAG: hypothetical protein K2J20_05290, partial [Bacilli bacterium]|nr:hypothetical protein [Bacilli bacterium]
RLEILDEKNNIHYTSVVVNRNSFEDAKIKRNALLIIEKSDDCTIKRCFSLAGKLLLEKMVMPYEDNELQVERVFSHMNALPVQFKIEYGAYYRDLMSRLKVQPCLTQDLKREIKKGSVQSESYHMHAYDYFSASDEQGLRVIINSDNLIYEVQPIKYANACYLSGICVRNAQLLNLSNIGIKPNDISVLNFTGYMKHSQTKHVLKIVKRNSNFEIFYTVGNSDLTESETRNIILPGKSSNLISSEELDYLINYLQINGDNDFIEAVVRELKRFSDKLHVFEVAPNKALCDDSNFNLFCDSSLEEIRDAAKQNKQGLFDSFEDKFQKSAHLAPLDGDSPNVRKRVSCSTNQE